MDQETKIWELPEIVGWTQIILNSYHRFFNQQLIDRTGDKCIQSKNLFYAPMVVYSHDNQLDPIYNYSSEKGLIIWDMTWEQFSKTPSRTTTEPLLREERQQILRETATKGYITNYEGVRISRSGKKYKIFDITLWNLTDNLGQYCGQAATFSQWQPVNG